MLESVYEECVCHELALRNLNFERQASIPVNYKGIDLGCGYRMDVLVEGLVVVELKSIEKFVPIHDAQLLSYMKLTGRVVGLLINFNVPVLKQGIRRKVLDYDD